MKIDLLTKVFPGKSSAGTLGLSTSALIRTQGKNLVFDTGPHGAVKVIKTALEDLQVDPEEVDIVFISHCHYDHINNLSLYPNAKILMSKDEWEWAMNAKDEWIPIESIEYIKNHRDLQLVEDGDEILPEIRALFTPGHTHGHMSLAVKTVEGIAVLAGDAVKNRRELILEYSEQFIEEEKSRKSIKKIKEMAYKVFPGHDGYLLLQGDNIIPQDDLFLDISLPEGCKGGVDGVFHLTVNNKEKLEG